MKRNNLQQKNRFLKLLNQESRLVDGHYQVPLPFGKSDVNLPNNRFLAMKRLEHFKRRFSNNKTFFGEYKMYIKQMLINGYAERSVRHDENESVGACHIKECIILTTQRNSG